MAAVKESLGALYNLFVFSIELLTQSDSVLNVKEPSWMR